MLLHLPNSKITKIEVNAKANRIKMVRIKIKRRVTEAK